MKEKPFSSEVQRVCMVCMWTCYLASASGMIFLVYKLSEVFG